MIWEICPPINFCLKSLYPSLMYVSISSYKVINNIKVTNLTFFHPTLGDIGKL